MHESVCKSVLAPQIAAVAMQHTWHVFTANSGSDSHSITNILYSDYVLLLKTT